VVTASSETRSRPPAVIGAYGVTKVFPGVVANDNITFEARAGEVHALLGENGSGKTTLCKILTGLYRPDQGILAVDGRPASFHSPRHAFDAGVFMVQQHFSLVERLTVSENMVLGLPRAVLPPRRSRDEVVAKAAERYRMHVEPDRLIWQLSVGERQRVEILKALFRGARTLILDEPTTVLTPQECDALFQTLRDLAAGGTAIIFISHKLREVLAVSDRVTVLHKGAAVAALDARKDDLSPALLAQLMVGRNVEMSSRRAQIRSFGKPVLEATGVSAENEFGRVVVKDVTLSVRAGEIVGVAGVAGNGQRELAEVLTGLRTQTAGTVAVGGQVLRPGNTLGAIRAGVGYVPEDRFGTGLVQDLSLSDNLILKRFRSRKFSRWSLLNRGAISQWAAKCIADFSIKGEPSTTVRQLSGGNAQKVLLARELSSEPRVLVIAAPTRGLDVAAMEAVRRLLIETAETGIGVLLIGEDLDEVLDMSDRIVVIYRGELVGSVDKIEADKDRIGLMMAGAA
jgi:ABC-type uncharacterized transport system ATPase subunit